MRYALLILLSLWCSFSFARNIDKVPLDEVLVDEDSVGAKPVDKKFAKTPYKNFSKNFSKKKSKILNSKKKNNLRKNNVLNNKASKKLSPKNPPLKKSELEKPELEKPNLNFSQIFVNNKIILKKEVDDRFNFFLETNNIKPSNQINLSSLYKLITDRMIEEELIRQKASNLKIFIDDAEIQSQIDYFLAHNFGEQEITNLEDFKNYLAKNNYQFADFYRQIETELMWQKIIEGAIRPTVNASYIEVKEWLEQEKLEGENYKYLLQDFVIGDATKDENIIKQINQEFKTNRNYRKFITNLLFLSNEDKASNASWFWSSELNQEILPKISNLKNNQFSEPILLSDGWHIFKLYEKKIDLNISIKQYDLIKNQVLNRKTEMAVKRYLQDLRKKSFIEFKN